MPFSSSSPLPNWHLRRMTIFKIGVIIGALAATGFGLIELFYYGNATVGYANFMLALFFLVSLLLLQLTRHYSVAKNIVLPAVMAFLVWQAIAGEVGEAGLFWFMVLPPGIFFLTGWREGRWWIGLLFTVVLAGFLLNLFRTDMMPFGFTVWGPFVTSLAIIAAVSFYIAKNWEEAEAKTEAEVAHRTDELSQRTAALNRAKQNVERGYIQLHDEKARLLASINSLSLGYVMTDARGEVLAVNPALRHILDWSREELSIADLAERLAPFFDLREVMEKCALTKKSTTLNDVPLGHKFLSVSISPVVSVRLTNDGREEEVIGTVILLEDVTERRLLERTRDEFFSIASHELRTPLTAIRGNLAMISDMYADKIKDPKLREIMDDIYQASIRLITLVNDFLDVSRLEQGRIKFKKEPVKLAQIIEHAFREIRPMAEEKRLYLEAEYPDGQLIVLADAERVEQIILNLVGNAVKFTHQGGITVKTYRHNAQVMIVVQDTGRGIPPTQQRFLFRKFQQTLTGEKYTKDVTQGTGLGLYISKLLVEGLGGQIQLADSQIGQGSIFVFTLPAADISSRSKNELRIRSRT